MLSNRGLGNPLLLRYLHVHETGGSPSVYVLHLALGNLCAKRCTVQGKQTKDENIKAEEAERRACGW
jgi:hypothetical protein